MVISGDPPWKEDAVSLPSGLQSLVEFFFFNLKSGKQFFFVPINGHVKGRAAMIHILVFK